MDETEKKQSETSRAITLSLHSNVDINTIVDRNGNVNLEMLEKLERLLLRK